MTAAKNSMKLIVPTLAVAFTLLIGSSAHAQVQNASGIDNASGVSPTLTDTVIYNGTTRTTVISQNTPNYSTSNTSSSNTSNGTTGNTSGNTSGTNSSTGSTNTASTSGTTGSTGTTGTSGTSGTNGSSGTTNSGTTGMPLFDAPANGSTGLPNTGMGGNAAAALAIIAASLTGVALGSVYFARKYVA